MLSGARHYERSEQLIDAITSPHPLDPQKRILQAGDHTQNLLLALTEAVLASAAAAALQFSVGDGMPSDARQDWGRVLNGKPARKP